MAAKFAMYFGIAMGVFSGFGLLIGCLATGRTRFNVCGAWKTRFFGRCCVIMVSTSPDLRTHKHYFLDFSTGVSRNTQTRK